MDLPVDRDEIVLLILDFLKSQNYIKSMITLESEANVAFEDLPEEIKFFRDLIVNGDFETGLNFLELFKKAENFPYDQCAFTIKKQQFLELVENNNEEEAESLINLSREIEKLTTRDNYNELCYLLTLKKVSDHPDYANWNIYKGRMSCFNEIKHHLKQILFTTAHKEKEKVKPNSLLKLLTGLVKSIFAQNKQKIAQFFTVGQNFSFLDPAFWNFIEEQTANARLSLVSNKAKNQNPYENLSRSIDFRKGLASSQDFRDFAMQSAHFENLRSAMEGQKHENFLASADKRNQAKVSESGVFGQSSQLAQSKNLQQGSERKSQNLADSSVTKKQAATLAESQKSEKKPSPQTKSPAKQQSPAQRGQYEDDFEEDDYYGKQTHEPQFTSSPQRSNVAKSKDFNKSNSGFGDQRESQNLQNVKKSLKESFSKNEEQKSMASEIRQSRFQAEVKYKDLENISAITKKEQQSRYQYEMFSELEQIGQIQDVQPIRAASFAPDGEMFAIGTNSKSLKIYTMRPLFIPKEAEYPHSIEMVFEKNNHHFGSIYSVDWSNTGRFIATGSNDKLIKVISVPDFKTDTELMELKLPGHKGIVRSIAFTLDDTRLLSGSADWSIKVWDVQEGMEIRTLQGHTSAVYCLQINGDGNLCISVGMDKCLKLWDLRAYECSVSIPMNDYAEMNYVSLSENTKNYSTIKNHEQRKTPGSITHSGNIIAAAAHMDGVVTLWDLTTRKLIEAVELHEADCRSVEFDSSSGLIATSSFDATIAIYDVNQRMVLNRITNHTDKVVFAKWHPFYPVILSTSADTTARLFAPQRFLQGLREENEEFS